MNAAIRILLLLCGLLAGAAGDRPESILPNGTFEDVDPRDARRPAGWDLPDGLGVQWARVDPPGERGQAIRIDTAVSEKDMVAQWELMGLSQWNIPEAEDNAVAATYGLSYYSDDVPTASGQAYRVSFDFRGPAGSAGGKVWVRGYGLFRGEIRRRYETIVNCRVPNTEWHTFSQVFHPTRLRPDVTQMKVMLYAYWPPGVYWFDNVRVEPISMDVYESERRTSP